MRRRHCSMISAHKNSKDNSSLLHMEATAPVESGVSAATTITSAISPVLNATRNFADTEYEPSYDESSELISSSIIRESARLRPAPAR
jgi:hypothetical protein